MPSTRAYAASGSTSPLAPFTVNRRDPGPSDVQFDILFCGVCHSDLHTARGEWPGTIYPCVPGHEIIGRVTQVGAAVTTFKSGELVGTWTASTAWHPFAPARYESRSCGRAFAHRMA